GLDRAQAPAGELAQPATVFQPCVWRLDHVRAAPVEPQPFGCAQPVIHPRAGRGLLGWDPGGRIDSGPSFDMTALTIGDQPVRPGGSEILLTVVSGISDHRADLAQVRTPSPSSDLSHRGLKSVLGGQKLAYIVGVLGGPGSEDEHIL